MRSRSPGKQAGFLATSPGSDFQKDVAFVVGVSGQQQALEFGLQASELLLRFVPILQPPFRAARDPPSWRISSASLTERSAD